MKRDQSTIYEGIIKQTEQIHKALLVTAYDVVAYYNTLVI